MRGSCLPGLDLASVRQKTLPPPCLPAALDQLLIVTGGDDQALGATLLRRGAGPSAEPGWSVAGTARVPNAHGSAVRGVWTDGAAAFSVGLDQRVRSWRVRTQGAEAPCLAQDWMQRTQVLEPADLAACSLGPEAYAVLVAGRGMEALLWRPGMDGSSLP